jgi:predicted nucleotidyltransferase component of viral defense system
VITRRELELLRAEWSLDLGVIEKDYVLGWLLAGIAHHPALARTWVFKGGTCLRKCYYETFRFSEDLDFTIVDGGQESPEEPRGIFAEVRAGSVKSPGSTWSWTKARSGAGGTGVDTPPREVDRLPRRTLRPPCPR